MVRYLHVTVILLLCTGLAQAQTDTLYTINGDRMVGEIKSLSLGVLTYKTIYSDQDFKVEWEDIDRIYTNELFRIVTAGGSIVIGSFKTDTTDTQYVILNTRSGLYRFPREDLIEMIQLEKTFFEKFDLLLSGGYSVIKADNRTQLTGKAKANYTADRWGLGADYGIVRSVIDTSKTTRQDASLNYRYFFRTRWFVGSHLTFFSNDEQRIKLRTNAALGIGNYLLRNRIIILSVAVGAAFNDEVFFESDTPLTSLESLIQGDLKLYGFSDLTLFTSVQFFPSLTEQNRYRTNADVSLKWDLPLDFNIMLTYTLNFDSNPPNNAPRDDYVLDLTVGWEL